MRFKPRKQIFSRKSFQENLFEKIRTEMMIRYDVTTFIFDALVVVAHDLPLDFLSSYLSCLSVFVIRLILYNDCSRILKQVRLL